MWCYWINPDRYEARRAKMEKMLSCLSFQGVERVAYNEVHSSKLETLINAHIKALQTIRERGNYPALLLEDDAALQSALLDYTIPAECDLLYLGGSIYNCHDKPDVRVEKYDNNFVRVKYMLSAHAIVFPKAESVDLVISLYRKALTKGTYNDIELALASDRFIFLAPAQGLPFYQDDYTEEVTRISLKADLQNT